MRTIVNPAEVLSPANPGLDIWTTSTLSDASSGTEWSAPKDPTSLSFEILKEDPTTGAQTSVVTETTLVLAAARIGTQVGHFAASWTVPGGTTGRHIVRWRATAPDGRQARFDRYFDVLSVPSSTADGLWFPVSDLRAEGVLDTDASDFRLLTTMRTSQALVERYTGRRFGVHEGTYSIDGSGTARLPLRDPVILVSSMNATPGNGVYDPSEFIVYNRAIRQGGFMSPDDRDDSAIELAGGRFHLGRQNVKVSGLFGYTEYDGSFTGCVPILIQLACKMICMRELWKLADVSERDSWRNRWRIAGETTRDQSYTMGSAGGQDGSAGGPYTGDRAIDDLLLMYRRPFGIGAA